MKLLMYSDYLVTSKQPIFFYWYDSCIQQHMHDLSNPWTFLMHNYTT